MVRVGTRMAQMLRRGDDERGQARNRNMTAKEQVAAIVKRTAELEEKKGRVYEPLMGELEPSRHPASSISLRLVNEEGTLLEALF